MTPDTAPTPAHPTQPSSASADERRLLTRAMLLAIGAGIILDAATIVLAGLIGGAPALYGALIGTGLALIISVPTLITVRIAPAQGIGMMSAIVLGGWLVKMALLVVAVVLVRGMEGITMPWVGVALLLGGLAAALTEVVLVARAKRPPETSPAAGEGPAVR